MYIAWPLCEGLRSAIYKSGGKEIPENYRGITILPVLEKVFEIAVYKRIGFVNEAFCKVDPCNGGFLEGRRTADNLFIIHGLAQRQIILNKNLILCFVDFSKAFDMVDRNILFYKMIKCGWHGKVIDTLRSLYRPTKTKFRVKHQGWLSHLVNNALGVNQGGCCQWLTISQVYGWLGIISSTWIWHMYRGKCHCSHTMGWWLSIALRLRKGNAKPIGWTLKILFPQSHECQWN